ncbi:MAG: sigma 54-interacting transcriptional regulator [Bacteriovoracaceae bacterium]|nr:sigma 54-interacting transcriptional regulator [Bacteriovoracaceae bacterium]
MSNLAHDFNYHEKPYGNIVDFGKETLIFRGLRMGDWLEIKPMHGRKKKIQLKRTKYTFKSGQVYECVIDNHEIILPGIKGSDFSFSLVLSSKGKKDHDDSSRYLLRSNMEAPFGINGMLGFKAFVERGDTIDMGYNRLISSNSHSYDPRGAWNESAELLGQDNLLSSTLSILIEGETGTGKSYLARKIHQKSKRIGNFVHINLSSFSENLIESELFGHVKGAFTGAIGAKKGAFREADWGTLFLDEIDSLPLNIQTKLLLFLDSKEVRPVGGTNSVKANVRLIFASGRSLLKLVENGTMRKDFYFRISSGASVCLESLRVKPQRIEKICEWFMEREDVVISRDLICFYKTLCWPGNIRQLLGYLEKKKIMSKGKKIIFDKSDEEISNFDAVDILANSEDEYITWEELRFRYAHKIFMNLGGNMEKSANILGISKNTLKACFRKRKIMPQ